MSQPTLSFSFNKQRAWLVFYILSPPTHSGWDPPPFLSPAALSVFSPSSSFSAIYEKCRSYFFKFNLFGGACLPPFSKKKRRALFTYPVTPLSPPPMSSQRMAFSICSWNAVSFLLLGTGDFFAPHYCATSSVQLNSHAHVLL